MDAINLDRLLEEQAKSSNLVVIVAIPDDKENVMVTPWTAGTKCLCGKGIVVPRNAIKVVTKTGKEIRCCNKTLQLVHVEFSNEKLVTYGELFEIARESRAVAIGQAARKLRKLKRTFRDAFLTVTPVWPTDPTEDTGDGDGDGDPDGDGEGGIFGNAPDSTCVKNCVNEFMAKTNYYTMPKSQQANAKKYFTTMCQVLCSIDTSNPNWPDEGPY